MVYVAIPTVAWPIFSYILTLFVLPWGDNSDETTNLFWIEAINLNINADGIPPEANLAQMQAKLARFKTLGQKSKYCYKKHVKIEEYPYLTA